MPIIACSTGTSGKGALAVIRVSGFQSLKKLARCFSGNLVELEVRKATLLNIIKEGTILDHAVVTFFKAPNSYTGENLLEISVHGNPLNIKRVTEYLSERAELEHALPGEFTFRAHKNGKLTLSQVEGLELLLRADSPLVLDQGMQLLQGELHERYLRLHKTFLDLKGAVELSIDFLEDVGEEAAEKMFKKNIMSLKEQIEFLYERSQGDYSALLSPTVVLSGKTNAGKSSLFNILLEESRSIVSEQEGTTRDFISEYVNHKDVRYRLVDTAGIRATDNVVEKEGVRRSQDLLKNAFFKILVINPFERDFFQFESEEFDLVVVTHGDRPGFHPPQFSGIRTVHVSLLAGSIGADPSPAGSIGADPSPAGSIGANPPPAGSIGANPPPAGSIGANLSPAGFAEGVMPPEAVKKVIWGLISEKYSKLSLKNPLLVDRHCRVIGILREKLLKIVHLTDEKSQDMGIVASEVLSLEKYLYSLIGAIDSDEVLENVFDNFCIGK